MHGSANNSDSKLRSACRSFQCVDTSAIGYGVFAEKKSQYEINHLHPNPNGEVGCPRAGCDSGVGEIAYCVPA